MSASKLVGLFLCCAFVVSALPANSEEPRSANAIQTEDDLLDSIYHDCMRKDTISCLKLKVYNYVDKMLDNRDTITVINGVQIVKTGADDGGAPRAITSEDTIESMLFGRFARFLENHALKVDLKGSDIVNAVSSTARSLSDDAEEEEDNSLTEEGRGKKMKGKKKKKGMLHMMMGIGGILSAIIGKIALLKVALIAKKALIIAKIAFLLSAFLGIKKLLASKGGSSGKHTTIDAYPAEHHSSGHGHDSGHGGHGGGGWSDWSSSGSSGSGGWGRSFDAHQMAYNAYPQAS